MSAGKRNILSGRALGANGIYNFAQSTGSANTQSCFPPDLVERYREIIHQMRYLERITNGKVKPRAPGERALIYITGILFGIGLFFLIGLLGMFVVGAGGFLAGLIYFIAFPLILFAVFTSLTRESEQEAKVLLPYREQYEALLTEKKWLEEWFWKNCKSVPQVD